MPTRLIPVDSDRPDPAVIHDAAETLLSGGLVAFPTETVYGLGADAFNAKAVERVFEVKGRPADNPIIVHLADATALPDVVASVPDSAGTLISHCWPGPLTLVLPAGPAVPAVTRGGLPTVAVRVPAHPVAHALIQTAGRPIAAPSANRSGRPSPTTAQHVAKDLDGEIDTILDSGPTPVGVESTVVDLTEKAPTLLRPGGISLETLESLLGSIVVAPRAWTPALERSPGTRYRHYAPRAQVVLIEAEPGRVATELAATVYRLWDKGLRVGVMVTTEAVASVPLGAVVRIMGSRGDLGAIAANLFAQIRELDDAGLDAIVVEGIDEHGVGRAVMDRLRRAASAG